MGLELQNDNYLKEVVHGLLTKVVYVPDEKDKRDYTAFQLFKECRLGHDDDGNRYFEIDANDKALPLMFDYQKDYFTYELWNVLNLDSVNQVDRDKLRILQAADGNIETVKMAYEMAKQQKHVDTLVGFMISMIKKIRNREVSQPVALNGQNKNRFVNFPQRDIDFEALEKLELEQLKRVAADVYRKKNL